MQKGRFHYYRQWHRGADRTNVEISQKEFSKLLAEHYCRKVTMAGDIGVSFADYEAAEIEIRKIKRRKQDMTIYSCGDVTLTFKKDRIPRGKASSRHPLSGPTGQMEEEMTGRSAPLSPTAASGGLPRVPASPGASRPQGASRRHGPPPLASRSAATRFDARACPFPNFFSSTKWIRKNLKPFHAGVGLVAAASCSDHIIGGGGEEGGHHTMAQRRIP